ncbi:MAG TPA: class I SAM-dependent methyltransferase [Rhodospirillales bacterium]|nr:class I SAM-dependent methyltransferase [Rhodospirillales bacterium]
MTDQFIIRDGIHMPPVRVQHRDGEYEEGGFETLRDMQERHFWYRGRHRFLLGAVNRYLPKSGQTLSAIDLGGGAGGWVSYLAKHLPEEFASLALADSSIVALTLAASVVPPTAQRYQVDLMQLHMHEQWDAAFLLDVIEHLPDDLQALRQAREALKSGGYLFVTTPAFPQFWSYNDDMAQHLRRYRRSDFVRLAQQSGLTLCDARYFMFYLSPFYLLSRMRPSLASMTLAQKKELIIKQHQVPSAPINSILNAIFAAESPLGHWLRFPWGTSILGVFKKT